MTLLEIFDTRRESRREAGDLNVHQSFANTSAVEKGYWLVDRSGKKLSGPHETREKALSFKSNRPDRIPKDATVRPIGV